MRPSKPAMATSADASPTLWRVLLWPHVRRLLGMQPFWALAFAAFFKSMEMASPSHSAAPFSFLHYLAGNLIGALTGTAVAKTIASGLVDYDVIAQDEIVDDEPLFTQYEEEPNEAI